MEYKLYLYKKMFLIREFENQIELLFKKGKLRGTVHGCVGQESIAVAVSETFNINDSIVISNHRNHGHFLALTGNVFGLACELMGKKDGLVNGLGGSQHLHWDNFFTNGITGGMIPIAVGMAYAKKIKSVNDIVVAYLGDGAMNEGYVMEAFNLASLYNLPILFILENNKYAMSTETNIVTAGTFVQRVRSFNIDFQYIEANNILDLVSVFHNAKNKIIEKRRPLFIECLTHRFSGHSKSDKRNYVNNDNDNYWKINDPMKKLSDSLGEKTKWIEKEVVEFVSREINRALSV